LKVTGSQLIDPSGKAVRLTGFNWPIEHVHDGDGKMMADKLQGANLARIIGVLWKNGNDPRKDCYQDAAPYFKESCFSKLDAAVKAATDAKVWVILAARCKYAAGNDYPTDPMANVFHNATLRNQLYTVWAHIAGPVPFSTSLPFNSRGGLKQTKNRPFRCGSRKLQGGTF
jgi:hypothetical protein